MNLNDLFNEEKVRLDPKCWTGKKIGNPKTKMKGGVRVNNCVPAESVEEGLDEAVGGNYLYHATGGLKEILQSGAINAARGAQDSTKAQTKLPTVSTTRDWGYASGSNATAQEGGISRGAVIVLDRNAVEQKYKTLGTSQSRDNRGLAFPKAGNLKAGQAARSYDTDQSGNITKADADDVFAKGTIAFGGKPVSRQEVGQQLGQAKHDYYTPKVGGEFEEAVVVPKGSLPIQGTMVGFWVNPRGPLAKDPTIMNDPRRLDMVRPNQFVKATQQQGVAEGLNEDWTQLVAYGIMGLIFGPDIIHWFKRATDKKVFKVFINGKDVSSKILNKEEAIAVINSLAKQEHDTKTQYAVVDTRTNNIVLRKTWSDAGPDYHGRGWVDSNESVKQGVAEEYELAGVGVAYELGRRAYKERKTARDNPYSATREARKNDEWAKGLERGKHDANDARHFRSSVREQGMADGQLDEKSVSQAQFRTMAAAAHNPKFAKKVGIKQSVAKEFNQADKGSNYKKLPDRTNEGGDVFMANIKDTPEYKAGFATGKLPVPHPEGTQQYASYYKGVIDKASPTLNKVGEGEQQKGADYRDPPEADYDDDYDAMVSRVKKLAGVGPMKTVYDPEKRVYRNVPTAVQPKR